MTDQATHCYAAGCSMVSMLRLSVECLMTYIRYTYFCSSTIHQVPLLYVMDPDPVLQGLSFGLSADFVTGIITKHSKLPHACGY